MSEQEKEATPIEIPAAAQPNAMAAAPTDDPFADFGSMDTKMDSLVTPEAAAAAEAAKQQKAASSPADIMALFGDKK
jgi:hypothetical protein